MGNGQWAMAEKRLNAEDAEGQSGGGAGGTDWCGGGFGGYRNEVECGSGCFGPRRVFAGAFYRFVRVASGG